MSTTEIDKYTRTFKEIAATGASNEELPTDIDGIGSAWSITYGGDIGLDSRIYTPILEAALNCVVEAGMYLTLVLEDALGNRLAFDCTVTSPVKTLGKGWGNEDDPHVFVYPYFAKTSSVGIYPHKVYLHTICNIHFP
jgi:hypothetical protein